jgi:predicted CoA-binding protein
LDNKALDELIGRMLGEKTWAVVGASVNRQKFGYKVLKRLMEEGYKVYPVNPNYEEIEGVKCYPALRDLPELPGTVSVIVPPAAGLTLLEEAAGLGIKKLWFQPGAESDEILKKAEKLGLELVHNRCVLIELE